MILKKVRQRRRRRRKRFFELKNGVWIAKIRVRDMATIRKLCLNIGERGLE